MRWQNVVCLGAFANLRKASVSFVVCVCKSVCAHGTSRITLDGFSWNFIFEDFSKICRENSSFIKIWQYLARITGTLLEDLCAFMISRWVFLQWEIFQTKVAEKIETNGFGSVVFFSFFSIIMFVWHSAEKHDTAMQTTGDGIIWRRKDSLYLPSN